MKKPTGNQEKRALALVKEAKAITVNSNESCELAGAALNKIKAGRKWWKELTDPLLTKANEMKKEAQALFKKVDDPLAFAEGHCKNEIMKWNQKLEDDRRREQRRLEEEARKKAEVERQQQIKELEKNGKKAVAREVAREPLVVAPVIAHVERPNLQSISVKEYWKFRVVDEQAIPREYLEPNVKRISAVVRALKSETRIKGIEVYCESGVSAGVGSEE